MYIDDRNIFKRNKAVVIGLSSTGLGVVRSLAVAGINVIAVESNPLLPGVRTKYCKIEFCSSIENSKALTDKLIEIARKEAEKPVLFMTADEDVKIVSEQREALSQYYHINLPDKLTVDCLMEKENFADFAVKERLPIPKSIVIRDMADLYAHMDKIKFPCILKPSYRTPGWNDHFQENKAYHINQKDELVKTIENIRKIYKFNLIVQEWIKGDDSNIHFCLMYYNKKSELQASFTGRKLIQWVPETGSTCIAENTNEDTVKILSKTVFNKVKYKGMGSVEFKLDNDTGEFKITEPTVGRANLQSSIAMLQGVNIPLAYYCDMIGIDYNNKHYNKKNVIWINEGSLLNYIYRFGMKKVLNTGILSKVVFYKNGFAYYCLLDLAPFLHYCFTVLARGLVIIKRK